MKPPEQVLKLLLSYRRSTHREGPQLVECILGILGPDAFSKERLVQVGTE